MRLEARALSNIFDYVDYVTEVDDSAIATWLVWTIRGIPASATDPALREISKVISATAAVVENLCLAGN